MADRGRGFDRRRHFRPANQQNEDDLGDFDLEDVDRRGYRGDQRRGRGQGGDRGRGRGQGGDQRRGRGHRGGRGRGRARWDGGERGMGQRERVEIDRENADQLNEGQAGARGAGGNRRGRGRGMAQRGGHVRRITYQQLMELKSKDASDIVITLASAQTGFASILKSNMSVPMMRVILFLLATACGTNSAKKLLLEVLTMVNQSDFLKQTVTEALASLAAETTPASAEADQEFLKNLLGLLHHLSGSFPSSIVTILGLQDVLKLTIEKLQETGNAHVVSGEIQTMITDLDGLKVDMFTKMRNERDVQRHRVHAEREPPDNFRDLSVFPNEHDIHQDRPFLRVNKETGGYSDLNQYLDIQFRLLREDFIAPLREGIDEYLQPQPVHARHRMKDIRVYNEVRILRTVCARRGLLHRLEFDVSKLRRVRWESTKRLIYGSLVCLSHDDFHTYLFATVSERDPKMLQQGIVDVFIEHNLEERAHRLPDTRFVMVETTAYFEAYRHVLKGLQNIQVGQLPFEKYIIECDNKVDAPEYLRRGRVKFDLRPLIDEEVVIREDEALRRQQRHVSYDFSAESRCAQSVDVLDLRDWPTPEQLHLDQSQYTALQTALTKEFVITQGPPGTGKTYVGLKIVKALLHNASVWNSQHHSPMLIVCYTNHALDQFLEGIDSFFAGNIIRVGGRSVSDILSEHTLKVKKQNLRKSRDRSQGMRRIGQQRFEYTKSLMEMKLEIERIGAQIEASEREILHEDMLRPFMDHFYDELLEAMDEVQFMQVQQGLPRVQSLMVEWLGLDQMFGEVQAAAAAGQDADEQLEDGQNEEDEGVAVQEEADMLQQQRQLDDDDDDPNPIRELEEKIKKVPQERSRYVAFDITHFDKIPDGNQQQFQIQKKARKKMKRKLLRKLRETERMSEHQIERIGNLWTLPVPQRWPLYRAWIHSLREHFQQKIADKERRYRQNVDLLAEIDFQEDKQVLQGATVIGMTTTGAARYQTILSEIKPRIVVVEEAAEVLEGHVITTLSEGCEHLILIGDHKQLKPNPIVYRLAKKYHLDLSLFERMINNGVTCDTLAIQHRMRPDISDIMLHIYPNLKDAESVKTYPHIKGISENVFFLTHTHPEKHDTEMVSHSNEFEAKYIVELCSYLLKQGYDRSKITVLTTYSGQLLALKKLMPKQLFSGVRVTIVDNFQGEENDIILLSLVRSNENDSVGFLKIENRVCVALSRAKHGLFVIGNFDLLSRNSDLWNVIVKGLREKELIGPGLKMLCQNHPHDAGFIATKADDFKNAPEGGCMKPCEFRLQCGHVCVRPCHPYDMQHLEYKCNKQCTKVICQNNHNCTRRCFQKCGRCEVEMEKTIPLCGHKQMVQCYLDPESFSCRENCSKIMSCGHKCGVKCGLPHQCTEWVTKLFDCGHSADVKCERRNTAKCLTKCTSNLACGHPCKGNCDTCHQGKLHKSCEQKCTQILVCGHDCTDSCSNCPPCEKVCENRCPHSKCFKKCGEICVPCMEPCTWVCRHHRCTRKCSEPCNRGPCNRPCEKRLACGHQCIGMCGEPCPKLCRVCNREEVTEILFGSEDEDDARFVELEDCQHIIEVNSLDIWMKSETAVDGNAEQQIQLKSCPKCKTVIRQNMRYGKLIRERLQDIEKVKQSLLGNKRKIIRLQSEIDRELLFNFGSKSYKEKQQMYDRGYNTNENGLIAIQNQLKILIKIEKLIVLFNKVDLTKHVILYLTDLEKFRQWILTKRTYVLSEQEVSDAQRELDRYTAAFRIVKIDETLKKTNIKLDPYLEFKYERAKRYVDGREAFTTERQDYVKRVVKEMKKLAPESGLGISEDERVAIVKAMGLTRGHWFKCKNGHVYAIGDCGGATVESRCPECHEQIGGGNHTLRSDNALATEMDGASHPAWSEHANMANFDMNDLL